MTSTSGLNDDNIIFAAGEKEVDRLQLQHEIMKDAMKDLIKAPLNLSKPGLQILDQATADGIWLKDVAAVSPAQHEYTGTDIEPYYPVPPPAHMTFFDQSMTKPWPAHMNATFDLVHSRLALPGAGITPIKTVVTQLIDLVKPGGWIQQTEMVYSKWPDNGPAMDGMWRVAVDWIGFAVGGQSLNFKDDLEAWYKEAGVVDVQTEVYTVGIGKKAGSERMRGISTRSMHTTVSGLCMGAKAGKSADPNAVKLSFEELDTLPERVLKELNEVGGYWQFFTIWGRKED